MFSIRFFATHTFLKFNVFFCVFPDHDPDIIAGFEVQQSSLGYLLERAAG
jgi:DNA polymerase elongation subunit (family B)